MPTQGVEALTQQLQQILSGNQAHQSNEDPEAGPSSSSSRAARQQAPDDNNSQQRRRLRSGSSSSIRPYHAALRRLRVRVANIDSLQQLLECVPGLTELQVDGPALSVQAAAVLCPGLKRLSYLVCSPGELDSVLFCLGSMRSLRALELEVKGMVLSTDQLRVSEGAAAAAAEGEGGGWGFEGGGVCGWGWGGVLGGIGRGEGLGWCWYSRELGLGVQG